MKSITATRQVACSLSRARQGMRHPGLFTCFPGVGVSGSGHRLTQAFAFPLLGERRHLCSCHLQEVTATDATLEAKGWMDGDLLSTALTWRLAPKGEGMQLTFTAQYAVPEAIVEEMVHALRRRSPLPIRSDADAILSRAVESLLEEKFEAYSRDHLDHLGARLEGECANS